MIGIGEQQTVPIAVDNEADGGIDSDGPEILVLRPVDLVERKARVETSD